MEDLSWRKSSRSQSVNQCVEIAHLAAGRAVRDSKDPAGAVLTFTAAEWSAFTDGVKGGEFS